jgi:two-component system OmpR family sensor kinase
MLNSVRSRLTLWYAAVLTCTLLLLSLVIYWIVKRSVMARTDAGLVELSDSFLATLEAELNDAPVSEGVVPAAQQSMLEHQYPGHAFAVLTSTSQLLVSSSDLAGSTNTTAQTAPNPKISQEILQTCLATLNATPDRPFRSLSGHRGGARCYARTFFAAQNYYQLVILASLHPESELLERLRIAMGWLIPFTIILASAGGYFLARRSLAPVADMTARAERIGESTLHDRLQVQNPSDELGHLSATFNRLLDRLDLAFERQRRFIADASHELRTPLAILQGESEVALSQPDRPPAEYRESLSVLQHEARRLGRIVEDMFTLSRADAGQLPITLSEIYLDELAAECVHSVRTLAAAKSISLSLESHGELPVLADESLLTRMLLNLLDNAIKYTPAGGKVTVTTSHSASGPQLSVADNGPGIPSEFQPHIFERFFRADQARSRANSGGGAGLGLSIAQWIAEAHHGKLELTRSAPSGTVFTVHLPQATVTSPVTSSNPL